MIVVDASVIVESTVRKNRRLQTLLGVHELAAPDIIDLEVISAVRGLWLSRKVGTEQLEAAAEDLTVAPIRRHPSRMVLRRVLDLRDNLTPYDAAYVALAEALEATLVTLDRRIAAAPGIRCQVRIPEL